VNATDGDPGPVRNIGVRRRQMEMCMDREQMKALIKEALLEMLAERPHVLYDVSPLAQQNLAAASASRADGLGQLMDRAEIFRLLD
jgi:hypothetical protein